MFNVRDLSKISAGILMIRPTKFVNHKEFVRVWRNELMRIICDRLSSKEVSVC